MKSNRVKYTFRGMNQDVSESKHPLEFYYEAHNIRLLTTDKTITGGLSFEKGNELRLSLPDVTVDNNASRILLSFSNANNDQSISYTSGKELDEQIDSGLLPTSSSNQIIIGHACSRNSVILFSTDDNGMDCIWEMDAETFSIKLLYLRHLGFKKEHPIQAVYNYENSRIEKVYWIDGINQLRFVNIRHSIDNQNKEELINLNSNTLNMVGDFKISQPEITDVVSGGTHTSGMSQYAYNLYRLNGAQTKLSPTTELIPLTKGKNLGGGDVNEIVGATPVINISNIDSEFTHIKVYAIKYTSYNQLPSISLIEDKEVPLNREINVFDDGNILGELSLEEFLFLGSDPIIPKHIESKDNVLFPANIKEVQFDLDIDTRAYSFSNGGTAKVYNDIKLKKIKQGETNVPSIIDVTITIDKEGNKVFDAGDVPQPSYTGEDTPTVRHSVIGSHITLNGSQTDYDKVAPTYDAINVDYDTYKYQADGSTLGGEGKYLKYELVQNSEIKQPDAHRYFKDNEVYRIGIEFYNKLGQTSFPKWMADFRAPEGNLEGNYNTLKVTLKPEFFVWLNTHEFDSENDRPVGYRMLRANRTLNDRTIIAQGMLNGMMSNIESERGWQLTGAERLKEAVDGRKLPSLLRVYSKHSTQMNGMEHLKTLSGPGGNNDMNEVVTASNPKGMIANTWQYNSIMQFFSPEVMFSSVPVYEGLKLQVRGGNINKENKFWGQERKIETKKAIREGKVLNGLTPHEDITQENTQETKMIGDIDDLCDAGIFGPAHKDAGEEGDTMDFLQFYRDFTGGFERVPHGRGWEYIYKKPQFTEKGQGGTSYNDEPELKYYNTLEPMITDDMYTDKGAIEGRSAGLTTVNSWGARCLTMVLGAATLDHEKRPTLDSLYKKAGISHTNVVMIADIMKNNEQIYLGGIYGGNSYEDKKRTDYIKIGRYYKLDENLPTIHILSPGDTFVHDFKFTKIVKTDTEKYDASASQITEIVNTTVETSIDLRNRNDISLTPWDSRFQPRYDEYHKYNRVYSQEPTLLKSQDADYNFRTIKSFDTRITATKTKIPGEYIDSWTDILVNEALDLNGQHGAITGLASYRDNIYAFQDNAFSVISINPRVQTQGNDGISIELGSGRLLHDYQYISTVSGTLNKWGVKVTNNAIYFLDGLNRSFMRFTGQGLEGLSSTKGLHKYLVNNLNINDLRLDNPILSKGISMGYDVLNNDVYLTYNNMWTLCFNEKLDTFTSYYDYNCPIYIYAKDKMLTLNSANNKSLYEMHAGKYNEFYGVQKPSILEFVANPEADHECLFTNLEYKSVAKDDNDKECNFTWDTIRVYNEFQDTGYRNLTRDNMRKLNRNYRISIPRNQNSRDRIRNNWAHIILKSKNPDHRFYLNQDIILYYIANYIAIE